MKSLGPNGNETVSRSVYFCNGFVPQEKTTGLPARAVALLGKALEHHEEHLKVINTYITSQDTVQQANDWRRLFASGVLLAETVVVRFKRLLAYEVNDEPAQAKVDNETGAPQYTFAPSSPSHFHPIQSDHSITFHESDQNFWYVQAGLLYASNDYTGAESIPSSRRIP